MHACSAGPKGRLACGSPHSHLTEHNHTCGELELSFTVRWARLGCIVLTNTTSPQCLRNPIVVSFRATVRGHRSWKFPWAVASPLKCGERTSARASKMGIWYGVASEFTWRPCGIMHVESIPIVSESVVAAPLARGCKDTSTATGCCRRRDAAHRGYILP